MEQIESMCMEWVIHGQIADALYAMEQIESMYGVGDTWTDRRRPLFDGTDRINVWRVSDTWTNCRRPLQRASAMRRRAVIWIGGRASTGR